MCTAGISEPYISWMLTLLKMLKCFLSSKDYTVSHEQCVRVSLTASLPTDGIVDLFVTTVVYS